MGVVQIVAMVKPFRAGAVLAALDSVEILGGTVREAMGYGCDCGMCFYPADVRMPESKAIPCKEQVVELALCRRGELIQAQVAVEQQRAHAALGQSM